MMSPGPADVRAVLLDQLTRIDGHRATAALARLALYDPRAEIRRGAVRALAARPQRDYRAILLGGFAHPWPAVADHAAEALVNLGAREAVPALVGLLDAPDPWAPYRKGGGKGPY
jgi:HEAT repeat protein